MVLQIKSTFTMALQNSSNDVLYLNREKSTEKIIARNKEL